MVNTLKFYLDTHISKQVALQLRQKGVDVVRCEEVGIAAADDEAHLEYAATEGRILISADQDFTR
jgi:predicted nuclease of predicted toxin-antitoxin system